MGVKWEGMERKGHKNYALIFALLQDEFALRSHTRAHEATKVSDYVALYKGILSD